MGLTIHYSLRRPPSTNDDVRELIEQLRQRALDLPFKHVRELIQLTGEGCAFQQRERGDPLRWLLVQAGQLVEHDGYMHRVTPTRLFAFVTSPGEGSEPANFGLCRYPRWIRGHNGIKVRTGLPSGWCWSSFCKTQYASNPDLGGVESFLKCHLSVIRLLDHARNLNVLASVQDEGGYWEKRDVQALVEEVAQWNAMIAAFVGSMKDLIGDAREMHSEITKFPDYEHLEAKGRAEAGDGGDEAGGE